MTPICATAGCASARPGSVSIAFKNVKQADVAWEREPDWYDSSPIAERPYCRECGTSLGFRFKDGSENMDLTVASFDDPSRFVPKHHFGAESMHRAWLNTEGLPEMRTDELPEAGRQMGRRDRQISRMSDAAIHRWTASDGVELAYHEVGEGRPVILLHGLFSDANMNWIKFGHAERIAAEGFRVIMPDLRAHGLSGQAARAGTLSQGDSGSGPARADRASRADRFRPRRLLAGRADDGRRRWARAFGRAARFSAARGSKGFAIGSGARLSSSRRSTMFDAVPARRPALAVDPVHEEPEDRPRRRGAAARKLRRRVHGLARGLHHADAGRVRRPRTTTMARPRSSPTAFPMRSSRKCPEPT